jgi:hypothetical protein
LTSAGASSKLLGEVVCPHSEEATDTWMPYRFVIESAKGAGSPLLFSGLVLPAKSGAQVIELGGVFVGQDELLGVETVLEGVLRRTELPDGAFGPGTVLGVGAICF